MSVREDAEIALQVNKNNMEPIGRCLTALIADYIEIASLVA